MMNLYNGGAEKSLVNLLNNFDYNLYDVNLMLFQKKGLFLEEIPKDVTILDTPDDLKYLYQNPDRNTFKSINNIKAFLYRLIGNIYMKVLKGNSLRRRRQLRWKKFYRKALKVYEEEYDVAIAYLECEPTYYVIDKVNADKKIVWVHNDYLKTGLDWKLDLKYMQSADKVVSISEECVQILKNTFLGIKNKFICLPNLTSEIIIKQKSCEVFNLEYDADKFKILSIGRLNEQKGFDLAINAAKLLKDQNKKFQWFIMGDGELKEKLDSMIKKYELENYVFLIGVRSNPYPYIKGCDLLVQSSRFEGKSVVLDEAKILGTPILATNYPTVKDQVNENIGMIVDMNSESIAKEIVDLIENKERLKFYKENLNKIVCGNINEISKYYKIIEN